LSGARNRKEAQAAVQRASRLSSFSDSTLPNCRRAGCRTSSGATYMFRGKQYIVVAVGSREHAAEYVALSLP
jgi:hypothetical protein